MPIGGKKAYDKVLPLAPAVIGIAAFALILFWLYSQPTSPVGLRIPGTDRAPETESSLNSNAVLAGKLTTRTTQLQNLAGAWNCFRGGNRNGVNTEPVGLARRWQTGEPREIWGIDVGEGYAGAAVLNGRVYMMDYDRDWKQDALRCLSLEDGQEIWRYAYSVAVKRNHGMSRTVPAVTEKHVVAIGPKCHVVCADAQTGQLRWGVDLVRQYGATVPPWYAGQCPLIDQGMVILAPGGKEALLLAVELETGKPVWRTPNPHNWKMTHSSVMPMLLDEQRIYLYCANNGVVGVSAVDGSILWETDEWKIGIATVPSPLILDSGRIFFSGGYNSGSLMVQLSKAQDRVGAKTVFKLGSEVFGATQHTPIFYDNHIFGARADGKFICLNLEGQPVWTSGTGPQFGLGSFLIADGLIFAMNDSGLLRIIEATPARYNLLGQAQILKGRESWAPLALAGGRLIARDFTRMVCLDVAAH